MKHDIARTKTKSYFVGIYGFMQLSMIDVGLLDNQGFPIKKKKPTQTEQDAIWLYNWVSDKLRELNTAQLRSLGAETDKRVQKLISDHSVVNNYLLSIYLFREYVDNDADKFEQGLLRPKIDRIINLLDEAVTDEEFDADIRRTTARTADNIYRQITERPQLSDEVRDAKFKRIRR